MTCKGRLRNIRFKSVRARILSVEYIPRVLVSWEMEPTSQNLKNLRFFVDRGESPSDLRQLNAEGVHYDDRYEFIDYTASLYDAQKHYGYRVRAVEMDLSTGEALQEFSSEMVGTEGTLDPVGMYVVEEHLFKYRYVDGVPVLFYIKKNEGERCPECWDSVMKRVTKSSCKTCFGTGYLEGYYPPIDGWLNFGPQTQNAAVGTQGVTQPNKTQIDFTDWPNLRPGDVIFEIQNHLFWRVSSVVSPEKNRVPLLQQVQVNAINRSDIEYKLLMPKDRIETLLAELEARKLEPEF